VPEQALYKSSFIQNPRLQDKTSVWTLTETLRREELAAGAENDHFCRFGTAQGKVIS